ncbi:hypothetical protein KUTeg_006334 [Tegillarca granosa]|uniref:Uncharacterized protein n=1 Tax=Tegillarca granosa TaxID=220873 RepID=A0ABQ9FKW3_TEGGR|nr:hypothetical protein KUTeg_006334 [Tegillarca granosa]
MDLQQALTAVLVSDNEDNFSDSDNDENETSITTGETTGDISFEDESRSSSEDEDVLTQNSNIPTTWSKKIDKTSTERIYRYAWGNINP